MSRIRRGLAQGRELADTVAFECAAACEPVAIHRLEHFDAAKQWLWAPRPHAVVPFEMLLHQLVISFEEGFLVQLLVARGHRPRRRWRPIAHKRCGVR